MRRPLQRPSAGPPMPWPFWGAKESRPPETAPVDLKDRRVHLEPCAAETGADPRAREPRRAAAYVYRNGVQIGVTTVSSGRSATARRPACSSSCRRTRTPLEQVQQRADAVHATPHLGRRGAARRRLPGYPSSTPGVHLPSKFAEELFAVSPMGMTVVVVDEHNAPAEVAASTGVFAVAPKSGSNRSDGTTRGGTGFPD